MGPKCNQKCPYKREARESKKEVKGVTSKPSGCPVPGEGPAALGHCLGAAHRSLVSTGMLSPSIQAAEAVSDTPHPWRPQRGIFMATVFHSLLCLILSQRNQCTEKVRNLLEVKQAGDG